MSATERLMRYAGIDTQSDPDSQSHPSSEKQFDLARLLVKELRELGVEDAMVDEHCYVYGHLPSNISQKVPAIGFIAHMDTSPDYSGAGVSPRIIENYDGKDIPLSETMTMKISDFPWMRDLAGKTLMVTDGTTLLGADDKAGIAAIMEAVEYFHDHSEEKHGPVSIAFTPDEEIGRGTACFDPERFQAEFAFTMDGDSIAVYSDETFNAETAHVEIHGFSIHPGAAKNRMKNASLIACEFIGLLPDWLTPAHTENREGFLHLTRLTGTEEKAEFSILLRDFDSENMRKYEELILDAADFINRRYGEKTAAVTFSKTYQNMHEILGRKPEISSLGEKAIRSLGYEPQNVPIRGGTDGATLTFMGIPCPNLGCGGNNFHGPYEYCVLEELEDAAVLIRRIIAAVREETE